MVSENELLGINVNDKRKPELFFVGTLLQLTDPVLQIQVESWKNMIVIIVRTSSSLYVYHTEKNFAVAVDLEPIQKISTNSPTDKMVAFRNGDDLILVIYNIKKDSDNELV